MMRKKFFGYAVVVLGLFSGCVSSRTTSVTDPPWNAQDEAALEELAAQQPSVAPDRALPPVTPLDAAIAPRLEIHVFNIGQGDSMLVIGPPPEKKTLLIDLGEPTRNSQLPAGMTSSAAHVLQRIREITGNAHVDYFLLTHYHSDHAGRGLTRAEGWGTGIIKLISDFSIDFSVGEFIHVGDDGAAFMKPAGQRGVFETITRRMPVWIRNGRVQTAAPPVFGTTQIDLGAGVTVDILAFAGKVPNGSSAFDRAVSAGANYAVNPGDENDLSIALQITAGEFEMWTGGDLNGTADPDPSRPFVVRDFGSIFTNIEHHLVEFWTSTGRETDVEVYRANHHGSGFSSTAPLVDALDPELILYSTGADSQHPSDRVVTDGGRTADQLATTAVIHPTTFMSSRGRVVGEVTIIVAADGTTYTVNGQQRTAFTNAEEASGADAH